MGNLFLFRPEQGRNYHKLASQTVIKEHIAFLRAMGSKIGITDFSKVIPYAVEAAGEDYLLSHVHEPYLFYNLKIEQFGVADIFLNDEKAVLSYCHFNQTDCNDKPMVFPKETLLKDLFGMEKIGEFVPHGEVQFPDKKIRVSTAIQAADFKTETAKILAMDSNGKGLAFENEYGNGRMILVGFSVYAKDEWSVSVLAETLKYVGENSSVKCDNPNVFFARFDLPDGRTRFDLLNMNCAVENGEEEYCLTVCGKQFVGTVGEGEIKTVYID